MAFLRWLALTLILAAVWLFAFGWYSGYREETDPNHLIKAVKYPKAPSPEALVAEALSRHRDKNPHVDRQVIVVYDISRLGQFDPDRTPALNDLLASLLFDPLEKFKERVNKDAWAGKPPSIESESIDGSPLFPLVPPNGRAVVAVGFTGMKADEKDRLATEIAPLGLETYSKGFEEAFFYAGRHVLPPDGKPRDEIRAQFRQLLPDRRENFQPAEDWAGRPRHVHLSMPTVMLPLAAAAASLDYFASLTVVVRVTDLFSGNVSIQENESDMIHVPPSLRDRVSAELWAERARYSNPALLLRHTREAPRRAPETSKRREPAVFVEVFPVDLRNAATAVHFGSDPTPLVPLETDGEGYRLRSLGDLDEASLLAAGLEPVWDERIPIVSRFAGETYALRGLSDRVRYEDLPNPYQEYKYSLIGLVAAYHRLSSSLGMSLPVVLKREWSDRIPALPIPTQSPWPPVLLSLLTVGLIVLEIAATRHMMASRGVPEMEALDEVSDEQTGWRPAENSLYPLNFGRSDEFGPEPSVARKSMIVHVSSADARPKGEFFLQNAGGGRLTARVSLHCVTEAERDLYLDDYYRCKSRRKKWEVGNPAEHGWQLGLSLPRWRVLGDGAFETRLGAGESSRVRFDVSNGRLQENDRFLSKIVISREDRGQDRRGPATIEVFLDLRVSGPLERQAVGVDIGTVGSCAAIRRPDSWEAFLESGLVQFSASKSSTERGDVPDYEADDRRILVSAISSSKYEQKLDSGEHYDFEDLDVGGSVLHFSRKSDKDSRATFLDFKRFLTEGSDFWNHGRVRAEHAMARMLHRVLQDIQGQVTHVTLTVPNDINGRALDLRRWACRRCGVERMDYIREAEAVAVFYFESGDQGGGRSAAGDGSATLFYDFGGGTLDYAVVRARHRRRPPDRRGASNGRARRPQLALEILDGGSFPVGGADIDREIAEFICDRVAKEANRDDLRRLMMGRDGTASDGGETKTWMSRRYRFKDYCERIKRSLGDGGFPSDGLNDYFSLPARFKIDHPRREEILEYLQRSETIGRAALELKRLCEKHQDGLTKVILSGRSIYLDSLREALESQVEPFQLPVEILSDPAGATEPEEQSPPRRAGIVKYATALAAAHYGRAKLGAESEFAHLVSLTRRTPTSEFGRVDAEDRFHLLIGKQRRLDHLWRVEAEDYLETRTGRVLINLVKRNSPDDPYPQRVIEEVRLTVEPERTILKLRCRLDDRREQIELSGFDREGWPLVPLSLIPLLDRFRVFGDPFRRRIFRRAGGEIDKPTLRTDRWPR